MYFEAIRLINVLVISNSSIMKLVYLILGHLFGIQFFDKYSKPFFEEIIGYDHIKRLFRMALDSDPAIHILLVGLPASAKTMFLTSLMQPKNSYFSDGANSSKAGMIDYLLTNRSHYFIVGEIDKMTSKDQVFLLNVMETGIVSETKYRKTRSARLLET